jgi:purine-binding chemotaxis protein CheW
MAKSKEQATERPSGQAMRKFIQTRIDGQLFGLNVETVEDILLPQEFTPIPLAPPAILGLINLRGRTVTIISLRRLLGLPEPASKQACRNIVLHRENELYSFVVDSVSEIQDIQDGQIRKAPENLSAVWKELSLGVCSLEKELMVMLDINKIFNAISA